MLNDNILEIGKKQKLTSLISIRFQLRRFWGKKHCLKFFVRKNMSSNAEQISIFGVNEFQLRKLVEGLFTQGKKHHLISASVSCPEFTRET